MFTVNIRHSQNHIRVYFKIDTPSGILEITQSAELSGEKLSPDILAFIENLNKNPESMQDFKSLFNPIVDKALSNPQIALSIENKIFNNYTERLKETPAGERL